MADISNKMLAGILIVSTLVSLIGIFTVVNKQPMYITGFAANPGSQVNVTIDALVAITATDYIDFGHGYVKEGHDYVVLISNDTSSGTANSTWTGWTKTQINITNTGNVPANITVNASSKADTWIGANAEAYFATVTNKCNDANNTNTWTQLNQTQQKFCFALNATAGQDLTHMVAKIQIPSTVLVTSASETKRVDVTFFAIMK